MATSTDNRVIKVTFVDQASATLRSLSKELKSSQTFASTLKLEFVKMALSFASGQAIVDLVKKGFREFKQVVAESVQEFYKSEQELSKMNSVLKATGGALGYTSDALQRMAQSMMRKTIFDDETIMAAQTYALTLEGISKETFPRMLTAAADLATVMGTDLQGAVEQLGIALSDPETGLTRLRRAGIIFTQEQTKLIKSLAETGETAKAQNIILTELESRVGGAAVAMGDTAYGASVKFKNEVNNLKENIGALISYALKPMLEYLTGIAEKTQAVADAIAAIANKPKLNLPAYMLGEAVPSDLADRFKALKNASDMSEVIAMNAAQMKAYREEVVALLAALEAAGLGAGAVAAWLRPQAPVPTRATPLQQNGIWTGTGFRDQTEAERLGEIAEGVQFWGETQADLFSNELAIVEAGWRASARHQAVAEAWLPQYLERLAAIEEYNKQIAVTENNRMLAEAQARKTGALSAYAGLGGGLTGIASTVMDTAAQTTIGGIVDFGLTMFEGFEVFFNEIAVALPAVLAAVAAALPIFLLIVAITEVLAGVMEILQPMLDAVLKPVHQLLKLIGNTLGTLLVPIFEALAPTLKIVCDVLGGILVPLFELLEPVFRVVAFAIQVMLLPIQAISRVVGSVYNFVIDLINSVIWFLDKNAPGLTRVVVPEIVIPVFHSGGIADSEMFALLRRDEEVLSPSASRAYREGGGGITIIAPNARYIDASLAADLVKLGLSEMRR